MTDRCRYNLHTSALTTHAPRGHAPRSCRSQDRRPPPPRLGPYRAKHCRERVYCMSGRHGAEDTREVFW